jgi:hypothetical protein
MKYRFIFLSFVLYILSCSNRTQTELHLYGSDDTGGFKQFVDTSDTYYVLASEWKDKLSLANIENGSKDFEMRLWVNGEILYNKTLYVIKYTAGEWGGKFYRFRSDTNSVASFSISPKSGWSRFEKRLLELQIKQLPNFSFENMGGGLVDDGTTFMMEIATSNFYRFAWFSNPDHYAHRSNDAKIWKEVVSFFRTEFEGT